MHVDQIRIRDLHFKTGEWVRRAALGEVVVITDRGRPIASLVPVRSDDLSTPFSQRRTLPEFDTLPVVPGESARSVSGDRDRDVIA